MKIFLLLCSFVAILFGSFDFDTKEAELFDTAKNTAHIKLPNLKKGQSGIVIHKYQNNIVILDQAIITSSNDNYSVIKFLHKDILPQKSLAKSNLKPTNGDIFVLNHLAKTSLLIVPNKLAKQKIKSIYISNNFIDEDFFAAYLKLIKEPLPTKDTIRNFCIKNQIGTIFFYIQQKVYIVDTLSFQVVDTKDIKIDSKTTQVPFSTNISNIKKGFWDFGDDQIKDYNKYYLNMIKNIYQKGNK